VITVVVPVYKEEKNIRPFLERCVPVLEKLGAYEIIFALDPSPDNTMGVIEDEIKNNHNIKLLLFSRRFGQPAATIAGLQYSKGDYAVVIDVDLQDQPELIADLYKKAQEGYDVVYATRKSRQGEKAFRKIFTAFGYYIINKLSDVKIPRNTGDFRIMSRKVVEHVVALREKHGFLKGLVAFVGFKQTYIEYDRDKRFDGTGNYNSYTGPIRLCLNGIFSYSVKPIEYMSMMGFITAFFSFLLGFYYILQKFIQPDITPGLPTTVLVVTFFSGVQLMCIGILGEYIGRIYDEVKDRPMYIIDKIIDTQKD